MASDSSELTFVRCSSCRSLVPAVSTRCRMCGAPLDSSADQSTKEPESDAESRVRQRTNSGKAAEPAAFGGIREARSGARSDSPFSGPLAGVSDSAPQEMQEPEMLDPQQSESPELDPVSDTYAADYESQQEAPAEEDPLSAYIKEVSVEEKSASNRPNGLASKTAEKAQGFASAAPVDAPAARVTVESGPRMRGKESTLMFGRQSSPAAASGQERAGFAESERVESAKREPSEQPVFSRAENSQSRPVAKAEPERSEAVQARQPQPLEAGARKAATVVEHEAPERSSQDDATESRRSAKRRRSRKRGKRPEGQGDSMPMPNTPERRPEQRRAVTQMASDHVGRLRGWLVDYSDGVGRAIELREGKFFISGSKLKPSDLVIDHPSVSTPHAMVQITPGKGFVVQDLMSENGISICRKGQNGFEREEDAVVVENGDSIRFGQVEFIVSLIAEVGVK